MQGLGFRSLGFRVLVFMACQSNWPKSFKIVGVTKKWPKSTIGVTRKSAWIGLSRTGPSRASSVLSRDENDDPQRTELLEVPSNTWSMWSRRRVQENQGNTDLTGYTSRHLEKQRRDCCSNASALRTFSPASRLGEWRSFNMSQ